MLKIGQEPVNLILLETSLKVSDHATFARLVNLAQDLSDDSTVLAGIGQVDFLVLLSGLKKHPLVEIDNLRLLNIIKCYPIARYENRAWLTSSDSYAALICAKLNPKVTRTRGLSPVSSTLLPALSSLNDKSDGVNIAFDAYLTLGWADLILIVTADDLKALLELLVNLRSIVVDAEQRLFLFSTSFSQIFLRCVSEKDRLLVRDESDQTVSRLAFETRVYCKPGGHESVVRALADKNQYFMLGKSDIGFTTDCQPLASFANFLFEFRNENRASIYATKTDPIFRL